MVAFLKRKVLLLALALAWFFGIAGAPLLNWLPPAALVMIGVSRYLLAAEVPASGLKSWAKARAIEIQEVNKWHLFWQITAVAVAAEIAGALIGSPFAVATFFVICSPYVINRLIVRSEIASLKRVREVIARGKLKEMERVYQGLDKLNLPKTENALRRAILPLRTAAALALELAAKNNIYYGSIFSAAASNVMSGEYGVKFIVKELGDDPAIYNNIDRFLSALMGGKNTLPYPSKVRQSAPSGVSCFRTYDDFKSFDRVLKKILGIMNAVVGEDILQESSDGLAIIIERGFFYNELLVFCGEDLHSGKKLYVEPAVIRICLECKYEDFTNYVIVGNHYSGLPELKVFTAAQLTAYEIAVFFDLTLKVPFSVLAAKQVEKREIKVSELSLRLKELVIEELKGQAQDIAIEAVAEKFFGDNAELVAELIGECMKERAGAEIAEIIAEAIVGHLTEEGINILSELVSN